MLILDTSRLVLPIKSYEPKEICLFKKKDETPLKIQRILMAVTPSDSVYQRTFL
jgi:hypothetical protein